MGQLLQNARTEIAVIDRPGILKCNANTGILIFQLQPMNCM